MQVDIPNFDPRQFTNYFKENALVGRDDQIKKVNEHIYSLREREKYTPIICSTSRGMGKTAFMQAIGMQSVKENLKNKWILDAIATGRILSFDFAKAEVETAIPEQKDIRTFFTRLMIYFLCQMFHGFQVDGICFQFVEFNDINSFRGRQSKFSNWKSDMLNYGADRMMEEYMRLTNIAFGVECRAPPVFLLDEIQGLCIPTTVRSKFETNTIIYHSFLSLLLTQLAGKHKPVCICTGTSNGGLIKITEKSAIIPVFISLSTLHKEEESRKFWNQMTIFSNFRKKQKLEMVTTEDNLVNSIVYAACQVPRLISIGHSYWFKHFTESRSTDRLKPLQDFEDEAIKYYEEMGNLVSNKDYTPQDISHIMMSCGVRWQVQNIDDTVPGTKITWDSLIKSALVFPYLDNCYIFPLHLVWKAKTPENVTYFRYATPRQLINEFCRKCVKNLDVKNLYVSYDKLRQLDLFNLGVCYETLLASSLAVKYYLMSIDQGETSISLNNIYTFGNNEKSAVLLRDFKVDFSGGIAIPDKECFVNSEDLPRNAVIHNTKTRTAHHDIILPATNRDGRCVAIPVSCKASFALSGKSTIELQQKVSKTIGTNVELLIWSYLGNAPKVSKYGESVAFIDGSGCCNGLALDMFILTKKLISENNKTQ